MENRIRANKRAEKTKKVKMSSLLRLIEKSDQTISKLEKKTNILRSTISGRLSDLEKDGLVYKVREGDKKESIYKITPKNMVSRKKSQYAKMRVNCILKTLNTEYSRFCPKEIRDFFSKNN